MFERARTAKEAWAMIGYNNTIKRYSNEIRIFGNPISISEFSRLSLSLALACLCVRETWNEERSSVERQPF